MGDLITTAAPKGDLGGSSSHPSQGLSVPGCAALSPALALWEALCLSPLPAKSAYSEVFASFILSFCKEEGKKFLNTIAVLVQEEGASPHLMQSSSYLHNL